MRYSPAAILLVFAASNAMAQNPPPAPWGPSKTNAARLRWLQYTMAAGRITVSSAYHGTNMTLGPLEIERRRERLQIQINPAAINLRYDLATADEQLRIELIESNQLRIRRTRSSPQYELAFEQAPDKPLVLVVDTPQGKHRLSGPGFWHLYLAEPELVRRHLIPLLEILHPSWQLASVGEAIEGTLIARASMRPWPRSKIGPGWSIAWPAPSFPNGKPRGASWQPKVRWWCLTCRAWTAGDSTRSRRLGSAH